MEPAQPSELLGDAPGDGGRRERRAGPRRVRRFADGPVGRWVVRIVGGVLGALHVGAEQSNPRRAGHDPLPVGVPNTRIAVVAEIGTEALGVERRNRDEAVVALGQAVAPLRPGERRRKRRVARAAVPRRHHDDGAGVFEHVLDALAQQDRGEPFLALRRRPGGGQAGPGEGKGVAAAGDDDDVDIGVIGDNVVQRGEELRLVDEALDRRRLQHDQLRLRCELPQDSGDEGTVARRPAEKAGRDVCGVESVERIWFVLSDGAEQPGPGRVRRPHPLPFIPEPGVDHHHLDVLALRAVGQHDVAVGLLGVVGRLRRLVRQEPVGRGDARGDRKGTVRRREQFLQRHQRRPGGGRIEWSIRSQVRPGQAEDLDRTADRLAAADFEVLRPAADRIGDRIALAGVTVDHQEQRHDVDIVVLAAQLGDRERTPHLTVDLLPGHRRVDVVAEHQRHIAVGACEDQVRVHAAANFSSCDHRDEPPV